MVQIAYALLHSHVRAVPRHHRPAGPLLTPGNSLRRLAQQRVGTQAECWVCRNSQLTSEALMPLTS